MSAKDLLPLFSSEDADDPTGLIEGERETLPSSPELPERGSFDPETGAHPFNLVRRRLKVAGELCGGDSRHIPVFHHAFWIPGKVPSLNDLLEARGAMKPVSGLGILRGKLGKGKGLQQRWDLYNDIKQDWKRRTIKAVGSPFVRVKSAYFGYLIVEENFRRDPSNFCSAAIKFIEDGLVEAGVIQDDGWKQVLGIRMHWVHRPDRNPGIYVVMSDEPLNEVQLAIEYEEAFLAELSPIR